MTLIKNTQAKSLVRDAVVLDLGDLKKQAQELIARAQDRADSLVAAAREEADQLIASAAEKGHKQGLATGHTEGMEKGRSQAEQQTLDTFQPAIETLIERWQGSLDNWNQQHTELFEQARRDVLGVALELAGRIVGRVVEVDPTIIESQIAEALALTRSRRAQVILINPDDREIATRALARLVESVDANEHIRLCDDPTILRGGCIVRTSGGAVDATIETQLRSMTEALLPASDQTTDAGQNPGSNAEVTS